MRIAELLKSELADAACAFVFPTEVAARFWLRRALGLASFKTLPSDRFLSWDRFVREALDYGAGGRPAGRADRTAFAAGLLAENRRQPLFRRLVPAESAGDPLVFLPVLCDTLPRLHRLAGLPDRWPASSAGKLEDLRLLDRGYRDFLRKAGLYEPAFLQPTVRAAGRHFRLFYPEVLEEFPALERCLAASPQVTIHRLPPADLGAVPPIIAWEDSLQEVTWVLRQAADLLDAGEDPAEIAISAADLPALEAVLARQAELLEVPLTIHRRRPLADTPPCRVFERIQAAVDSRFSLPALRDLLLDRSLPWHEERLGRELVRVGAAQRVLRSPPPPARDRWEEALRRSAGAGEGEPLRAYYRRLRSELGEIAAAPDFRRLKERLTRFSKSLLNVALWTPGELGAWQFALDTLDSLGEAARLSRELPASAFRTWLSYLADCSYSPQEPEAGLGVYAFPVSAGISPKHHFVIGASQQATRRLVKPLPFLGAHEEEALGLAGQELDLAEARLRLYCLSGGGVRFSYARRGPGRSYLPPGLFVAAGAVRDPPGGGPPHPYETEAAAWAGRAELAAPLLPVQQEGFRQALSTSLAPKGWDAAVEPLTEPSLLAAVLGRLRDPSGLLRLSPTGMQTYFGCPFRYLLERALGLEEEEPSPVEVEPKEFGSLMHEVLHVFGRQVREEEPGARLDPARRRQYSDWVRSIASRVFDDWASQHPAPVEPAWKAAQSKAIELAEIFIDTDIAALPGRSFLHLELHLAKELPELGVLLRGIADRVSAGGEGCLLVDYKKNHVPTRAQIFGEHPTSLQMPVYAELLAAGGLDPASAAYYSIEQGKYTWVFGGPKPMSDAEGMARAREGARARVAAMAAALASGDFAIPEGPDCEYCRLRATCRGRYALRQARG